MGNFEFYLSGIEAYAYRTFGCHKEDDGYVFTVWAPNAQKVQLIGTFNDWDGNGYDFQKIEHTGIWRIKTHAKEGDYYKFRVTQANGVVVDKIDPYAFECEVRPNTACKIAKTNFRWSDSKWMKKRTKNFDRPMNIYELHAGAFKLHDGTCTYETLIDDLVPYLKEKHYTHVEFMPLTEYPFDGSWGYQVTGYFSVTSRYGTTKQLKKLVNALHNAGIGVIFDFVPVHFVSDNYALAYYDGTPCYEYANSTSQWGTSNFDLGKCEVQSFLMSSANYWLEEMHGDGLRMDAISNLIFYEGDKRRGQNNGAITFIQRMNDTLNKLNPTCMLIAEDSSDYANVTKPTTENGLGFDYKWDLGWMNDTLNYLKKDPVYRQYHHYDITFSMAYFYSERFIMEFSHDEVVHGKATIVNKMWGTYEQKFAQARALYVYMMTHPGKKLNFMGNELGMFREFDEKQETDWDILKYPMHDSFSKFIVELNKMYQDYDALYEREYDPLAFEWSNADDKDHNVFTYVRYGQEESLVVAINFSPNTYHKYAIEVPFNSFYKEIINSDENKYGGYGVVNKKSIRSKRNKHGRRFAHVIEVEIGGFSAIVFKVNHKGKWRETC